MAETKAKTKPTATRVDAYLDKIPDERRRKDCKALVKIMKRVTGSLALTRRAKNGAMVFQDDRAEGLHGVDELPALLGGRLEAGGDVPPGNDQGVPRRDREGVPESQHVRASVEQPVGRWGAEGAVPTGHRNPQPAAR